MPKKKFTEEFGLNLEPEIEELTDYETFPNKVLLDELRNKIIASATRSAASADAANRPSALSDQ